MKKHRRITAFALTLILCIGAVLCTSAAQKDLAELSAKTGLEAVGSFNTNAELTASADTQLPSYYSSADLGLTLDIRTQHANTCWAFGALSSFETLLLKNGESNVEIFAPQHANYWGIKREDGTGWQRSSSNAGYSFIPLGYLTSWAGPLNESDFPEQTSTQEDYNSLTLTPQYGLTEAIYFDSTTDRDAIKELIYTYGSAVANFNSDFNYLTDNKSFYCGDSSLTISQLQGHCVSVVGWDDNYSKENFCDSISGTPENDGAWLIKNSWGTGMSDLKGYFWISYEDVWMFDDIFGPSYALTSYEEICEDVKLYQNEIDGATYEFSYLSSSNKTITYMNAFDFTKKDRTLDKVVFESTALGCDYTVYYIPFDGDSPSANTAVWEKLYKGTISYTGYICVDITDIILPEGMGAIGIEISNTKVNKENSGTTVKNSIGVCEWLQSSKGLIFVPQSEHGYSYYMDMDKTYKSVTDVMDFYKNNLSDDVGGTFVIKAITRNECEEPQPSETTTAPVTEPTSAVTTEVTVVTDPTEPVTTYPVTSIPATTVPMTSIPTTASPVTTPTSTDATEPVTVTNPVTEVPTTVFDIAEPFSYYLGDTDLSGTVNIKDATLIQKHAARLLTLTDKEIMAADVNKNGNVNIVDATYIQKFVASIQTDINVGQLFIYFE